MCLNGRVVMMVSELDIRSSNPGPGGYEIFFITEYLKLYIKNITDGCMKCKHK